LLVGFLASLSTALVLVLTRQWHERLSADAPGSGPQKVHEHATPRVGGVAIMVGFAVAIVAARLQLPPDNSGLAPPWFTGWLIVALFVPFLAGLVEDITKSFGARLRLIATFLGAALAYYFCDAALNRFDFPPLDALLASSPTARFVFTLFCVGAIANAYNLADGLNGLLAGLAMTSCSAMTWVAWQYGDQFLAVATGSLAAATLAFALFNFPRARLFAGDGGAYLLGSAISLFAILLCHRQSAVSPWFVFALVLYPFVDTSTAILRRLLAGRPIMAPDADHMHSLIARLLTARLGPTGRNLASAVIVVVSAITSLAALALHRETVALVLLCGALVAIFAVVYFILWRKVRTPSAVDTRQPMQPSS